MSIVRSQLESMACPDISRLAGPPTRSADQWLSRENSLALVLLAATTGVVYVCYRMLVPFLTPLTWALALAVLVRPMHDRLSARVRNAHAAAGISVAIVGLALLALVLLLLQSLTQQAATGAEAVQENVESGAWRIVIENNPRLAPILQWTEKRFDVVAEVQRTLKAVIGDAATLLANSVWLAAQFLFTLFALFYFLRDRSAVLELVRSLMPLSHAETDEVFRRVSQTIHGTIFGKLAVAVVPYLGAFVVWGPVAAFMALSGDWGRAAILAGWGLLVVSLIDNLLYPTLLGAGIRLHTLLVFIAIIGGLSLFGAAGLILGPALLAIADALIEIWRRRTAGGRTAEAGVRG